MGKRLKEVWHDPVWSKVIAAGIISFCGAIWAVVHFNWWQYLVRTYPVPVWLIVVLIVAPLGLLFRVGKSTRALKTSQMETGNLSLEQRQPQPIRTPAQKHSLQSNLKLVNERVADVTVKTDGRHLPTFLYFSEVPGSSASEKAAVATFRNQSVEGSRVPTIENVRAHIIFRSRGGDEIGAGVSAASMAWGISQYSGYATRRI